MNVKAESLAGGDTNVCVPKSPREGGDANVCVPKSRSFPGGGRGPGGGGFCGLYARAGEAGLDPGLRRGTTADGDRRGLGVAFKLCVWKVGTQTFASPNRRDDSTISRTGSIRGIESRLRTAFTAPAASARPPPMSAEQAAERITLRRYFGRLARVGGFLRRAWKRRWVKVLAIILALPFVAYFILWLIFARNLPSAEALLNYEPVLPTYVRDINGAPVQSFARERRVQLTYDEFPPQLINAFIAAEDRTFFSHGGVDIPGIVTRDVHQPDQQRTAGGRLDDHPAGRQEPLPDQRGQLHPQDPRAVPRPPASNRC